MGGVLHPFDGLGGGAAGDGVKSLDVNVRSGGDAPAEVLLQNVYAADLQIASGLAVSTAAGTAINRKGCQCGVHFGGQTQTVVFEWVQGCRGIPAVTVLAVEEVAPEPLRVA